MQPKLGSQRRGFAEAHRKSSKDHARPRGGGRAGDPGRRRGGQWRAKGHRHDPQPVPGRGSLPGDQAPDIPSAIDGAGTVWNELQSTKFPERAAPLAREIKALEGGSRRASGGGALAQADPVRRWRAAHQPDPGRSARDRCGVRLPRAAAGRAEEERRQVPRRRRAEGVRGELPVDADHNDATGTGPLAGSAPTSTRA